jgi:hypothetical protein
MLPVVRTHVASSALQSIFAQNTLNNYLAESAAVAFCTLTLYTMLLLWSISQHWNGASVPSTTSTAPVTTLWQHLHCTLNEDSILVDHELPEVDWLDELRYNRRWLVDGKTAVTKRMHMLGRKYIMSARRASLSLMAVQVVARAKHGLPCT